MQVKSIAASGAFCNTFDLHKLPFAIKTFILAIFEWPLKTGFTVFSQDEAAISMLENNVGLLAEPFEEIVPKMDETLGNLMKGLLITVEDESREEQEFDLDTHAQDCTIL